MNKVVVNHYVNYLKSCGGLPKMFNPYNESEIKDIAPTLTTNCGHFDSSSTVLILEESDEYNGNENKE